MANIQHFRLNPIETAHKMFSVACPEYVAYDKVINSCFDYRIIRQSSHDGTLIFHHELIGKIIEPLYNRISYCKKLGEWFPEIEYIIGDIHVLSVFGRVDLPCGNYPGEKERVWIPVKIKDSAKNPSYNKHLPVRGRSSALSQIASYAVNFGKLIHCVKCCRKTERKI